MKRSVAFWTVAVCALIAVAVVATLLGSVRLHPAEVWSALLGRSDEAEIAIVRVLRLPRIALAAFAGAGLAVSGGALQSTLRNPLAEPYLLGVSGGAAVGAVLTLAFTGISPVFVPLAALGGAAAAIVCVLAVARSAGGRSDPRILLMAGVVVGAFANAAIMVVLSGAPPEAVRSALWWMMGSAAEADWVSVGWLATYVLVAMLLLAHLAPQIDALAQGEETAASLGVRADAVTMRVFLLASLLAAATVAAAGLIGFVGLVVPHIARAAGIRRQRQLIMACAIAGATLLIAADVIARTVLPPRELPLGAVTALIGVPFFLVQLRRIR